MDFRLITMFFLFPIGQVFGQITDFTSVYHPVIHKAEMKIIHEDYKEAFELYQSAFDKVRFGFARDYYNALLCAIEVDDLDSVFKYLEKLAGKGVERWYFTYNETVLFSKIKDDPKWKSFLDLYEYIQQQSYLITVDYEVLGELGRRDNLDQEVRNTHRGDYNAIQKIDNGNIEYLVKVILEKGFPSEEMLGKPTPVSGMDFYHNMILHHMKNWKLDTTLTDLRPFLRKAVRDGKITPERVAYYLDLSESRIGGIGTHGSSGLFRLQGEQGLFVPFYKEEDIEQINMNRAKLGLCTWAERLEKLKYSANKNKNKLKFRVVENSVIDSYPAGLKDKIKLKAID